MPTRLRIFYSVLIAALLCTPAVALYRELARRADIWWTPAPLALSLADSKDRVEIYARGHPLGTLVDEKRVSITDGTVSHVLNANEIRLRFNNWDRVRADRLPVVLMYAAACGAAAILLLLVATGRLAYRAERA